MGDRLSSIEATLRELEGRTAAIERRLARLEIDDTRGSAPADDAPSSAQPVRATPAFDLVGILSLSGRTFVVLGGAYLLRALTETGALPRTAGIALGLLYALLWLGAADRVATRRPPSAVFHGLAAVLIGPPVIWEATTRFTAFSPVTSAAALSLFTALGLVVAWHRSLGLVAGAVLAGALPAALALSVATGDYVPFAVYALATGLAAVWLGEVRGWHLLRWPAALAANLLVAGTLVRALYDPPLESPPVVLALLGLFVLSYLAEFAADAITVERAVGPFEMLQTTALVVIGVGGAAILASAVGPRMAAGVATAAMLAGAAGYAVAVTLTTGGRVSWNGHYFAILALTLTVIGSAALLGGRLLDGWLLALAVLGLVVGTRTRMALPLAQAAAYTIVAAVTTGLAGFTGIIWIGPIDGWPDVSPFAWTLVLLAALAIGLPRLTPGRIDWVESGARLTFGVLAAAGAGGLVIRYAGPWLTGMVPDSGRLASLRTIVLAGAVVLLSLVARRPWGRELGWLAYPVLALGALKLAVGDFWRSTPSTLFVALACYGVALIVASRLARR